MFCRLLTRRPPAVRRWRSLRSRPELWRALHVSAESGLSPAGLTRLLAWAHPCAALDVSLDASRGSGGFGVKDVLSFVGALTAVTALYLNDKVNAACMKSIVKKHGSRLRSLSLKMCVNDMKTLAAVFSMVAALPALETLELSRRVLGAYFHARAEPGVISIALGITPDVLDAMQKDIAKARGGGSSLITYLRAPVTAPALAKLGAVFPELTTLHLPMLAVAAAEGRGVMSNMAAVTAEQEKEGDDTMALALYHAGDLVPLLRLERLSMNFAGERYYNPSPLSVACVLLDFLPAPQPGTLRQLALRTNLQAPSYLVCPMEMLAPGVAAGLHTLLLQGFSFSSQHNLEQLRELTSLTLDGCAGSAARDACEAVDRCPRLRMLRLANIPLKAADVAALPASQLENLTLDRCGTGAPAALQAAARAGALSALETLTLHCPAHEPLKVDAAAAGYYHLRSHDTDLKGIFASDAPLPALKALTLGGADLCAAQWSRLSAPALRAVTLLHGASTRSPAQDGLKRSAAEWETLRAAAAAAVARACPRAAVVVFEESERKTGSISLLHEGPHGDGVFYA